MGLGNGQGIALYLCLGLHHRDERLVGEIDLIAQSVPNVFSHAAENQAPPVGCGCMLLSEPRRQEILHFDPSDAVVDGFANPRLVGE